MTPVNKREYLIAKKRSSWMADKYVVILCFIIKDIKNWEVTKSMNMIFSKLLHYILKN